MDAGLENVVAAETVLSCVDGQAGRLIIRGYPVGDLAAHYRFEEVVSLLWGGFFDTELTQRTLAERLGRARVAAFEQLVPAMGLMAEQPTIEGVRTALSLLPDGHSLDEAISAVAMLGVATAFVSRAIRGNAPIAPDPSSGHSEDILHMIHGVKADPSLVRGLDAYLVTVAEHGLNASTFVARAIASTQAGLVSAVIGGVSALKGPLHGGAPGPVLDMLDGIGRIENAESWIRDALERGDRLMGFGHRVYRVRDPRADALKAAAAALPQSAGRLQLAQEIEASILTVLKLEKPDRKLDTNVEYYTAILLEALGMPREAFTCVFACARVAGWIAHAQEQLSTRRIIRPKSNYIGPSLMPAA